MEGTRRNPLHRNRPIPPRRNNSYSSFVQPSAVHLEILVENLHCPSCVSYIHWLILEARITEWLKANHATAVDVTTSVSTQIVAITIRLIPGGDVQIVQDSVNDYIHALVQADFNVDSASVSTSNELGQRRPEVVVYTTDDPSREGRYALTHSLTAQHVDICEACRTAQKNNDADNTAASPLSVGKANNTTIHESEDEDEEANATATATAVKTPSETVKATARCLTSIPGILPPQAPSAAGGTHATSACNIVDDSIRKQVSESEVAQTRAVQPGLGGHADNGSGVIDETDGNLNYGAIRPPGNAYRSTLSGTSDLTSFLKRQSTDDLTASPQYPNIKIGNTPHNPSTSTTSPMDDSQKEPLKVVVESISTPVSSSIAKWRARFSIDGMTCSSCSGKITSMLRALPYVHSAEVNLINNFANVEFEAAIREDSQNIIDAVEDMGFGCQLDEIEQIVDVTPVWEAIFSIEGMTCSACSGKVFEVLQGVEGVRRTDVNLMQNSAIVEFEGGRDEIRDRIITAVDDLGFGIALSEIRDIAVDEFNNEERTLYLKVDGMFCPECPKNVLKFLREHEPPIKINKPFYVGKDKREDCTVVNITYTPQAPFFTIRTIIEDLKTINQDFKVSVYHPPSIEERSKIIRQKELRRLYLRLGACFLIVIPSFLIGMVWMSFVPKNNKQRIYFEEPLWAGSARRMDWALLILSTPVMFGIADVFHRRAIAEIWSLWKPGNVNTMARRFFKFGSMNLLVSLGVSIAYFASVALLIKAACTPYNDHSGMDDNGHVSSFFDSTIFLTFFLLLGRTMETWSKAKTASAVEGLTQLRPSEVMMVVSPSERFDTPESKSLDTPISKEKELFPDSPKQGNLVKMPVDMLEVGDVVVVSHGAAPPSDGKIVFGTTSFDESSLTGEAAPVLKTEGDTAFAGTINQGKTVHVKLEKVAGSSMLDQIVNAVRQGQTKPAPMEAIADLITGYFVPIVTALAISTWLVWLALGYSGAISMHWKPHNDTWAAWSLEFAIAVFVIACPCGIGLAAPTALFVGTGLAVKYGILAKGGGEAFQAASGLDVIVFDKTGTLTMGNEPKVTDFELVLDEGAESHGDVGRLLLLASKLEEVTTHPLGRAVVEYCEVRKTGDIQVIETEEVPGRGLRGTFEDAEGRVQAIIGNESFMAESGVVKWTEKYQNLLQKWKSEAKSVVLLATREVESDGAMAPFELKAILAVADPLRPESAFVVKNLRDSGHDVWMISGDNPTTAKAVARKVGIKEENVLAGVLPNEKADKIKYLQQTAPKRPRGNFAKRLANALASTPNTHRAIVAMVGDGINDAPALANSDVGIAIGSGADIALNSAKFILVTSDLTALLTLTDLSRKVFARVFFNFFWASIYNVIMVPVAMGFFYPISQARLSPVWASAAMAGSSLSVVASSLLLKTRIKGPGFRPRVMKSEDFRKVDEQREKEGRETV